MLAGENGIEERDPCGTLFPDRGTHVRSIIDRNNIGIVPFPSREEAAIGSTNFETLRRGREGISLSSRVDRGNGSNLIFSSREGKSEKMDRYYYSPNIRDRYDMN